MDHHRIAVFSKENALSICLGLVAVGICLYWATVGVSPIVERWYESDGITIMRATAEFARGETSLRNYPYFEWKHFANPCYYLISWHWFGEDPVFLGWVVLAYFWLALSAVYLLAWRNGAGPVFAIAAPLVYVVNKKLVIWDVWWKAASLHFLPALLFATLAILIILEATEGSYPRRARALLFLTGALFWLLALAHNVQASFLTAMPFGIGVMRCGFSRSSRRSLLAYLASTTVLAVLAVAFLKGTDVILPNRSGDRGAYQVKSLQELADALSAYYGQAHAFAAQWFASLACCLLSAVAFLRKRSPFRGILIILATACFLSHEVVRQTAGENHLAFAGASKQIFGVSWPASALLLVGLETIVLLFLPLRVERRFLTLLGMLLAYFPILAASLFFNKDSLWQRYNVYAHLLQGSLIAGGLSAIVYSAAYCSRLASRMANMPRRAARTTRRIVPPAVTLLLCLSLWPYVVRSTKDALSSYENSASAVIRNSAEPYHVASSIADQLREKGPTGVPHRVILSPIHYWNDGHRNMKFYIRNVLKMRGLWASAQFEECDVSRSGDLALREGDLLVVAGEEANLVLDEPGLEAVWTGKARGSRVHLMAATSDLLLNDESVTSRGRHVITPSNREEWGIDFPERFIRNGEFCLFSSKQRLEVGLEKIPVGRYDLMVVARGTPCKNEKPLLIVEDREGNVLAMRGIARESAGVRCRIDLSRDEEKRIRVGMAKDSVWKRPDGKVEDMNTYIERIVLLTLAEEDD